MLILLLLVIMVLLLMKKEGFSPSNKPVDHENNMANFGPFDDIDYITPVMYPTNTYKKNSNVAPYVSNG